MDNPFLALFEDNPPPQPAVVNKSSLPPTTANLQAAPAAKTGEEKKTLVQTNAFFESVFAFTLSKNRLDPTLSQTRDGLKLLLLEGMAPDDGSNQMLTPQLMGQALTERLMVGAFSEASSTLPIIDAGSGESATLRHLPTEEGLPHAAQTLVVEYLCACYQRSLSWQNAPGLAKGTVGAAQTLIVDNLVLAFREPETHGEQDVRGQLRRWALNQSDVTVTATVIDRIASGLLAVDTVSKSSVAFRPLFEWMLEDIEALNFVSPYCQAISLVQEMARLPSIAEIFVHCNFPSGRDARTGTLKGSSFNKTVLGALLAKSCLPVNDLAGPWEFFESPSKYPQSVHQRTEGQIWTALESAGQRTHQLFNDLFKCSPKVRHLTLEWIGEVLHSNADRGKLWHQNSQMGALMGAGYVSDGFMLNLSSVLLRFCLPFTANKSGGVMNEKMHKLDFSYLSREVHTPEQSNNSNIHLREGWKETMLAAAKDGDSEEEETEDIGSAKKEPSSASGSDSQTASFNFITDIFFLTHKSLDLGFRVCHEKLVKTNQEIVRQQDIFRDLMANGGAMDEGAMQVQQRADALVTRFLSLKAALCEPSMVHAQVALVSSTAAWMTDISLYPQLSQLMASDRKQRPIFTPEVPSDAVSVAPEFAVDRLRFLPEFLVGNLCETLLLLQRFAPQVFEEKGEYLPLVCDFVLAYMGSPQLVRNPHLRARLAECLNSLLPTHKLQGQSFNSTLARDYLFDQYKYRLDIIPCILKVFVDIETTGQSVEFEVKFIYRRPMYEVLKFVWNRGSADVLSGDDETTGDNEYVEKMRWLARQSESRISDEQPPLFLRFVNLLINDAIYLLDEALTYMKQINESERERETSWRDLPEAERADRERQLAHTGSNARSLNILGLDTIAILTMLTSKVKEVFTHSTMVERVAAMLNYFLKTLVGPDRKSFKVKNQAEEFSFKPAEVVKQICTIYTHLAESEAFLKAVSTEGRSYSHDLFAQAGAVLVKVLHEVELEERLMRVADRVKELAQEGSAEEELFAGAPDEYLDPIMSHLMTDPVKLPHSGQIVDRMTIARHILSDQTDPFTRAPLTMDLVIPQDELKANIQQWMEEQKRSKK